MKALVTVERDATEIEISLAHFLHENILIAQRSHKLTDKDLPYGCWSCLDDSAKIIKFLEDRKP